LWVVSQDTLARENRELRDALLLAQAKLNRLDALVAQNARLKDLLDAQNSLGLSVQLARLVDVDLDPFRPRVVLDAGANQGVTVGQPVIDAHGIMGQIVEVLANTSVAMLITDPTHAIPVMVERSGLRTIAYGTGAIDRLQLPNIPISADVQVGDRLVTSGLGGRFPAGFPVGEILSISTDASSLFAAAEAKPAAQLDRSSDVLLLRDQPQPYGAPAPIEQIGPPRELAGPRPADAKPARPAAQEQWQ
jgi:rod shape-determining protein MreC